MLRKAIRLIILLLRILPIILNFAIGNPPLQPHAPCWPEAEHVEISDQIVQSEGAAIHTAPSTAIICQW